MKKFAYIISIFFVASLFFAGGALADQTVTLSASNHSIPSQTADGTYPALDNMNVSPNVNLSVFIPTAQSSYEIIGFNTKGNIEYGVLSTSSSIKFKAATAITTATGSACSTWATMGGSS